MIISDHMAAQMGWKRLGLLRIDDHPA